MHGNFVRLVCPAPRRPEVLVHCSPPPRGFGTRLPAAPRFWYPAPHRPEVLVPGSPQLRLVCPSKAEDPNCNGCLQAANVSSQWQERAGPVPSSQEHCTRVSLLTQEERSLLSSNTDPSPLHWTLSLSDTRGSPPNTVL